MIKNQENSFSSFAPQRVNLYDLIYNIVHNSKIQNIKYNSQRLLLNIAKIKCVIRKPIIIKVCIFLYYIINCKSNKI